MPTCFFIGHREAGAEVLPALEAAVERQITAYGVRRDGLCGGPLRKL